MAALWPPQGHSWSDCPIANKINTRAHPCGIEFLTGEKPMSQSQLLNQPVPLTWGQIWASTPPKGKDPCPNPAPQASQFLLPRARLNPMSPRGRDPISSPLPLGSHFPRQQEHVSLLHPSTSLGSWEMFKIFPWHYQSNPFPQTAREEPNGCDAASSEFTGHGLAKVKLSCLQCRVQRSPATAWQQSKCLGSKAEVKVHQSTRVSSRDGLTAVQRSRSLGVALIQTCHYTGLWTPKCGPLQHDTPINNNLVGLLNRK